MKFLALISFAVTVLAQGGIIVSNDDLSPCCYDGCATTVCEVFDNVNVEGRTYDEHCALFDMHQGYNFFFINDDEGNHAECNFTIPDGSVTTKVTIFDVSTWETDGPVYGGCV
ncbi:hypothetical protein M231_06291 [Tremella mesenterica]|uniref:Uncharacterized protein n=1 Tax=Tremella mesenterica TaxID=5217 RepID=A0A4Q1BDT3_TREME|nr:uncharacterized protein TREMEDRAFT_62552 [Tremella mesenterica DSM 1558]EIW69683.1 hypothetical protein TREMEDRAFT_62552 [Tremella mesenterica DSM 1558]RXK36447.1 hypothetical protein M231_06291 [Tremella mesenterica]